jgi:hypothetical protein
MAIRIENQYEGPLPKGALQQVEDAFDSLPREHTRGIERIRLVPFITEPRIRPGFIIRGRVRKAPGWRSRSTSF